MVTLRFERDDRLAFLREVPLFSDCTTAELRQIRSQMTSTERDAGDVLIREGTTGLEFFIIVSGSASVWRDGRLLDHLPAGSFFGELALLDGKCRSATVRAESRIELLVLSRSEFRTLNGSIPTVTRRIQAELGARLRRADDVLDAEFPYRDSEDPATTSSGGLGPW